MASTTANKKEIVDFLWDWATSNGDWSKLLIIKVVTSENNLTDTDRDLVFNYFLQSINLYNGLKPLINVKPNYTPTDKRIELESLSDITGVNKLAKKQTLSFSKNITIIFGENGTGKTGYSRILKNLGFSYDTNNTIYSNIYGPNEAKSATIKYLSNGENKIFNWNGTNNNAELQNISVFNNSCVQISLSDRQLIISPIGFHLFNIVSTELNELAKLLIAKIALHPTMLSWTSNLNFGTPQQLFISSLSGKSSEQKLTELSTFIPNQEQELKNKVTELSNLNKALLQTEIQNLTNSTLELQIAISKIEEVQKKLNAESWQNIIDTNRDISILERKSNLGIKEIAETNGIEFYETKQFQNFIKAAEDYIKIINKPNYPQKEDTCVYCKQTLNSNSQKLLHSYKELLNDKTQEDLALLKQKKSNLITQINNVDSDILFHQPTFGVDEEKKVTQPADIIEYNKILNDLKSLYINDKATNIIEFNLNYSKYLEFLSSKKGFIDQELFDKKKVSENMGTRETELKSSIAELNDRKLLSTKISEIKSCISNLKIVSVLHSKSNSFSTNSISRKTSDAREELVEQNFNDIFQTELKHFRKSDLKIELNFGTDKGKSKISHRLKTNFNLSDILSEGEQKAISLAEFLTELQLDNIKAPVIFDDPVNSLDHRIIDEVGKRLIELSKQRQVIIFTHSILFLHSLIQQNELDTNKQANVIFVFQKVKNNFGVTGILDDVEEVNSFSYYTKKLQLVIETKASPDQDEAKLASEGYGHLRSAIEIAVEDDILKKTIKRYKKGVAFPSLLRIDGVKLDANKGGLNDIYEKCCVSIIGHSSPDVVKTTPTIEELKIDYESFKTLRKNFT